MVRLGTSFVLAAVSFSTVVMAVPLPRPEPQDLDVQSNHSAPKDDYEYDSGYQSGSSYGDGYDSGYGKYNPPPMKQPPPMKEPPMKAPPMKEPPMKEPPMKEPPMKEPPMKEPPMKEPPMKEPPMKEPPMKEPPMKEPPMKEPPMKEPPMKEPPKQYTPPPPPPPPPPMKDEKPKEQPKWGSGSEKWGNDYNSCVSKCMATYGSPPTSYAPPPPPPPPPSKDGSKGSGKVHTVLVAPVAGVFRYVPPIMDVPVGDTIRFVWNGTNQHSVTKGSQLDMCNKTLDNPFNSGVRNGSTEFLQTINNTDTVYFFCTVGVHCAKGMFGIVNPKKGGNVTVASMMPQWTAQNPDLSAAYDMVHTQASGTPADTWGNDFDVSSIPAENMKGLAENILYYRSFLAENPGVQQLNQGATLPAGVTEFKLPNDISQKLSSSTTNPQGAPGLPVSNAPTSATPTGPAPQPSNLNSAAGSVKSSSLIVAVAAIAVTLLAL